MLHVTADTNIFISGLNFRGGNPFKFLELARTGKIRLAVSDAILDEMADVLRRKFDWPDDDISEARRLVLRFADRVVPTEALDVLKEDPPDNRILECAAEAQSDYIVTGDNHLLKIESFKNIRIVKVADFMEIARQHGGSTL